MKTIYTPIAVSSGELPEQGWYNLITDESPAACGRGFYHKLTGWKFTSSSAVSGILERGGKLFWLKKEEVPELTEEVIKDIELAYADSWSSKDEVDYDAEGHPHYYKSMDYERKIDYECFGKLMEEIYLNEILGKDKVEVKWEENTK